MSKGFRNWKKSKERLRIQVGDVSNAHDHAHMMCEDLMNQKQNIVTMWNEHKQDHQNDYQTELIASVDCIRFLLRQGLAFCQHDESENSINQEISMDFWNFFPSRCKR